MTKTPDALIRIQEPLGEPTELAPRCMHPAVVETCSDYRLVRIRAADSLASLDVGQIEEAWRGSLTAATDELMASFRVRPDDWMGHYNLGNFLLKRNAPTDAVVAYREATRLRPDAVMPLVNAAVAEARLGNASAAERSLRAALARDPNNAAASFNLGLLTAEAGRRNEAKIWLRAALRLDPSLTDAAYNLAVLLMTDDPEEATALFRQALALAPGAPKLARALKLHLSRLHQ